MSDEPAEPAEPAGPDLAREALRAAQARARLKPTDQQRMDAARARAQRRRDQRDRRGRGKGDPVTFKDAVEALLAARGWSEEAKVARVLGCWDSLVGEQLAAKCRPASLRDGELVVTAESTAWATQISLLRGQLVERLNTELGAGTVRRVSVHGPTAASGPRSGAWRVTGSKGPGDTYG